MTSRPVRPRQQATRDAVAAVGHYMAEAGEAVALEFINMLEAAYAHIGVYPESGSPRYALELDIPDLCAWPVTGFPFVVFYVAMSDHIDVWRLLHGQRDMAAWFGPPDVSP